VNAKAIDSQRPPNGAALQILTSCDVWDMMLPWVPVYWDFATLARYKRAGCTFLSLSLSDWPPTFDGTQHCIHQFKEKALAHADWIAFGNSLAEIDQGRRDGKLVLGLNVHDTRPIGDDVSRIEALRALGVRHMILAYQVRNLVADGCAEAADAGLSNFGRRVVKEMNRVGMIIDCTHTGRRSSLEAMELSEQPVIFSHSNAYSVHPHMRNLRDEQIRACAQRGGVIGIVGLGTFLGDVEARAESMFRHIDYVVSLVGPEYIGLGTDYVKFYPVKDHAAEWAKVNANAAWSWPNVADAWPDPAGLQAPQIPSLEAHCFGPEQLLELIELMLVRGYSTEVVKGILGANFKRVYATADALHPSPLKMPLGDAAA
jgi:membrane dipeptidase